MFLKHCNAVCGNCGKGYVHKTEYSTDQNGNNKSKYANRANSLSNFYCYNCCKMYRKNRNSQIENNNTSRNECNLNSSQDLNRNAETPIKTERFSISSGSSNETSPVFSAFGMTNAAVFDSDSQSMFVKNETTDN